MLVKFILLSCFVLLSSCDDPASSSEDLMQKLYVCDEGSDRVVILDASSDNLSQIKTIDINFLDDEGEDEGRHEDGAVDDDEDEDEHNSRLQMRMRVRMGMGITEYEDQH